MEPYKFVLELFDFTKLNLFIRNDLVYIKNTPSDDKEGPKNSES